MYQPKVNHQYVEPGIPHTQYVEPGRPHTKEIRSPKMAHKIWLKTLAHIPQILHKNQIWYECRFWGHTNRPNEYFTKKKSMYIEF